MYSPATTDCTHVTTRLGMDAREGIGHLKSVNQFLASSFTHITAELQRLASENEDPEARELLQIMSSELSHLGRVASAKNVTLETRVHAEKRIPDPYTGMDCVD